MNITITLIDDKTVIITNTDNGKYVEMLVNDLNEGEPSTVDFHTSILE